ncbi:hypothetical protein Tco_1295163 [Tanacetum coccineum]
MGYFDDLKLVMNDDPNGKGSSRSGKHNAISLDDYNKKEVRVKRGKTSMVQVNMEKDKLFTPPESMDICVYLRVRIITTNVFYDYWDGEEHMICDVKTRHFGKHIIMEEDFSLRKIDTKEVLNSFLEVLPVDCALDIYI